MDVIPFVFTVFFIPLVFGDLTLSGTPCGSLTCNTHEYCSPFEKQCRPCVDICDKDHHNFDANVCTKDCQDYLHDIRYVRTGLAGDASAVDFGGDIKKIYTLATVALTLVCLLIIALLANVAFKAYKWSRKNSVKNFWNDLIKKHGESDGKQQPNNGAGVPNGKADLRLEMPTSVVQSEMSPVTVTTSITTRRPAEDSALDYAYDNHGMSTGTPSPHSGKTARESNF